VAIIVKLAVPGLALIYSLDEALDVGLTVKITGHQ